MLMAIYLSGFISHSIILLSLLINHFTNLALLFYPYFLKFDYIIHQIFQLFLLNFIFSCWLDFENGLIWAFAAPMACVLIVNTIMFIIAIRIAKKSIQKRGEDNEKTIMA